MKRERACRDLDQYLPNCSGVLKNLNIPRVIFNAALNIDYPRQRSTQDVQRRASTQREIRYNRSLLGPRTRNILTKSISSHLFPLNLLPRNGQLASQPLKRALREPAECLVELILVITLRVRNAFDY